MSNKTIQRRKRLVLSVLGSAVIGLYLTGGALAVHDEGFQLDGNVPSTDLSFVDHDLVGSPPKPVTTAGTLSGNRAGATDWAGTNGLFNNDGSKKTLPAGYLASDFERDFLATTTTPPTLITSDATTFATGSKDGLDVSGWQCNTDNNVNSKIDIANGYAAVFNSPFNDPTAGADHEFLVFGLEKDVDNGDNNIGLWLLKDTTVGCTSTGKAKTFSGLHTVGDVLVVSAFTKGGGVSTISAYKWVADND